MSEYVIPLGVIPETPEELGAYIFDAYKWRGIVRCRDCKYSFVWWSEFYGADTRYCQRLRQVADGLISTKVENDGFCAWGVRRES